MYALSGNSLQKLTNVHPLLVRLAKRSIRKSPIDFGISQGERDYAEQVQLFKEKKTTILDSEHFICEETGFAHAIDIFAYVNGKAVWTPKYYGPIIQTFTTEAISLGVQIQFGHLWKDFQDSMHIQLNPRFYKK